MVFPDDWSASLELQSDHTKVSGSANLTDFPALIKDGNIPSAVYALLNNPNNSLDLELSSSQYASITDANQTGLDITGDLTAECWLKLEQTPATAGASFDIMGKFLLAGNQGSWFIRLGSDNKFYFFTSSNGSNLLFPSIDFTPTAGVWFHLATTYDASAGAHELYINGIKQGSTFTGGQTSLFNSTASFRISGYDGSTNYVDGLIADARIWSDIRTATEILNNYKYRLIGNEANLVGYWQLDNDYLDKTSNNNDLTSSGSPVFSTTVPPMIPPDLRFTSDSAGTTELPFEIVSLNTATETCEIWVKIPSLDYDGATSIYLWYGNASALPYSATDTYGSQAVWTGHKSVYHLETLTADSAVGARTLTNNNTVASAVNKIGSGADFGTTNSNKSLTNTSATGFDLGSAHTISTWVKIRTEPSSEYERMVDLRSTTTNNRYGIIHYHDAGGTKTIEYNLSSGTVASYSSGALGTTNWHYIVVTSTGSVTQIYFDGSAVGTTGTEGTTGGIADGIALGSDTGNTAQWLEAYQDETRIIASQLTADWITTEYNNQNDPSTFWTAITESASPSLSPSLSPSVSPSVSVSLSPSASASPSSSVSLSPSRSPSLSPSPSSSVSLSPSRSPSASTSPSSSVSLSQSRSISRSPSRSPSASVSPSSSPSLSLSRSPSASASPSSSLSLSPSSSSSASPSPSASPSATPSPSPSLSPSASASPSSSVSLSPSVSESRSPSSSLSPSPSVSESRSPSLSPSPSSSVSLSPSVSESRSISLSISPSPSVGFEDYTRGNYVALPTDDSDLEVNYSAQDYIDVSANDGVRVEQAGSSEFMIHQYRNFVGDAVSCQVYWDGQTDLSPNVSTVYLQIYNYNTTSWENVDSDNTTAMNTDFILVADIADLTNYKDASNVITCRVYQEAV